MPRGRVERFDPTIGQGVIVHSGHVFPVDAQDMEREAMVAGAPVRFDVQRGPEGARAVRVVLRRGTRASRRQRRFGDQVGAKYPKEKDPLRSRPVRDVKAPRRHPYRTGD